MLAALQAGNRGTQACITAASAVAGIIADLDTTIMFATAGTLNRENAETFADHRFANIQHWDLRDQYQISVDTQGSNITKHKRLKQNVVKTTKISPYFFSYSERIS